MDQGNYANSALSDDAVQGKFGAQEVRWVCPECETINTGDKCILCGYQMKQEKAAEAVSSENDTAQGSFGEQEVRWICPECETINTGDKCIVCGCQKKDDEPKTVPEKKRRPKWLWGVIAAVLCVAVGVALFFATAARKYKQAYDYLENGEYETAYQMFSELGDYKDSKDMCSQTIYEQASDYLANGEYETAYQMFSELGDYEDSKDMCNQTLYVWGKSEWELGNWAEAYDHLSRAGDYRDTKRLMSEIAVEAARLILEADSVRMAERYYNLIRLSYEDSLKVFDLIVSQNDIYASNTDGLCRPNAVEISLKLTNKLVSSVPGKINIRNFLKSVYDGTIFDYDSVELEQLRDIWKYPLVQSVVLDTYLSYDFMIGTWKTSNGLYIVFRENSSTSYTLPWVRDPSGANYYYLNYVDGCLEYVWESEDDNEPVKVFRFTFLDYDSMEVYCYKNDKTYTLYRQ